MIRIGIHSVALCFLMSVPASTCLAQKKTASSPDDPQALSLEVVALQTLNRLDLSTPQLEALLRMTKGTAGTPSSTSATKVSPAFVKTLKSLRSALLDDDEDRITEWKEKLGNVMDKENIQLDDRVPISGAARRAATQMIRLLQPGQVLAYLQILEEEEVDPLDVLEDALDTGKDVDAAKWKTLRDQAAADSAWLIVGSDEIKSRPIAKSLATFLDQHHAAKSKNAALNLEKQVRQFTASLDPFEILRHAMEREMAELLSNPHLPHAIQHIIDHRRRPAAN